MKSSVKSFIAAMSTILMVAVSCNKELAETTDSNLEKHTCEMKLVGSLVNFDEPATRSSANATTWADGSVIYLRMASPLGSTTGEAVYNATTDVWTISYYGSLYEGSTNECSALYLEDIVSYDNSLFEMNAQTVLYEDLGGSYIYEEGDLVVTANLKPKTGRIRFTGTPGSILKIYGITHYSTYDINTDIYTTSKESFKLTVGEDGFTPYFYGFFTDEDEPNVKVWIDAKEAYTRFCSKDIFNAGQSGKMTIPTSDSHNGWVEGLYFCMDGAKFKMIAVEGGTFVMGDPASTSAYYTPHNVTLSGFCIAETEMTNQIYGKKLKLQGNNNASSYTNQLPYYHVGKSSALTYVEQINNFIGSDLTLPTEAQWEFAARGGVKSKGYIYSGSDNLDDVGWYNCSAHAVKSKLPNELGIYDMSGNVYEHVLDDYAEYPSNSQVNPCHDDTNDKLVVRGGSMDSYYALSCTNYARFTSSSNNYQGIRFAINW